MLNVPNQRICNININKMPRIIGAQFPRCQMDISVRKRCKIRVLQNDRENLKTINVIANSRTGQTEIDSRNIWISKEFCTCVCSVLWARLVLFRCMDEAHPWRYAYAGKSKRRRWPSSWQQCSHIEFCYCSELICFCRKDKTIDRQRCVLCIVQLALCENIRFRENENVGIHIFFSF